MRILVCVCAALLALTGCGSDDDAGTPGAESSVVEPTGGGTSPDTPEPGGDGGSVELPGLPIGGSVAFEAAGTSTCAFLAWNADVLPAGVVVRIEGLGLPDGVAVDGGVSCDGPPCLGADSFTTDQLTCTVGLSWDGTPSTDDEPVIGASGSATCDNQDVCDQVRLAAEAAGGVAFVQLPETTGESS